MSEGIYRFADHNVLIRSHYESVHELCRNYRSEGSSQLIVETSMEEILREQEISNWKNRF